MSKKALGLVLVAALVLAFATTAFAAWGDSTYLDPANMVPATGETTANPHGPYDTTSRKCAVCHAVHGADPNGVQLLRSGATDPCVTCHIATDAGIKIVYKGQTVNYTTSSEFAHNNNCKGCHTVHGAGATTVTGAANNLKGLASMTLANPNRPAGVYGAYSVATNGSGPYTLSEWCSSCHPYYNTSYNGPTHVMNSNANQAYTNPSSTVGAIAVAYANSNTCTTCHDATQPGGGPSRTVNAPAVLSNKNFPHYTDGARFLLQAADASSGKSAVAAGQAGYDAVCLKCHRDGAGNGVGLTF